MTALGGLPTGAAYPKKDDQGNLLETEYGLCQYKDSQVRATCPFGGLGGRWYGTKTRSPSV